MIRERRAGEASPAAAGMLAPSVEQATGAAHDFSIAARDRYPAYVEFLTQRTGIRVPLNRLGILQVALSEKGVKGLRKTAPATARWIDAKELYDAEPALSHAVGAMYNPDDGAVDNTVLLSALEKYVAASKRIVIVEDAVTEIKSGQSSPAPRTRSAAAAQSPSVTTRSGTSHSASRIVLAAGAWAGLIPGARFARAVQPARGQLIAYALSPMRHVAYGPRGYVVPRGNATIGGSTMEKVGFDPATTEAGVKKVRAASEEICPALSSSNDARVWAGLRPVTPDLLPIIGRDPEHPSLIYACGHSRNGVLMAPLTGDLIADLVTATPLSFDLSQFRPDRF
jgi:glycine oxidase